MFKDAKVGDKVYDITIGWGVVMLIAEDDCSILVKFQDKGIKRYDINGYENKSNTRSSLYWSEIEFNIPKKPLPKLEIDTPVIVSGSIKRHFSHFSEDGKIYCFDNGRTSWTTDRVTLWDNWELAEKEDLDV
jgi:hypothetical protein